MKYIECPKKYELAEIFGIEEPERSEIKSGKIEPASGIIFGDIAHNFLSQLNFREKAYDHIIDKLLLKNKIDGKMKEEYTEELERIVERFSKTEICQQLNSLPEDRIKKEEKFFIEFDGVIIEGKIDLMYEIDEKWILVDYKTDVVDSSRLEEKAEHYKPQLMLYAKAIKDITKDYPLRTSIYFTRSGVEREIEVNDKSIADVGNELKDMIIKLGTNDPSKKIKESCPSCGYYKIYCDGV